MEIKKIILDNQNIEYELNIKDIKKCYLRIKSGKVIVNASKHFSIFQIENLIISNKDIILNKLNSYVSKAIYDRDGYVYIFNKKYNIILRDLKKRKCTIHQDNLYVYHHNLQKVIEEYLKEILFEYIDDRIDDFLVNDFRLNKPEIEIKKLKSRWGACFSLQNKVSFNLSLIHLDYELIDYVIVHELCHFLQPNHSNLFYNELRQRLPDYKQREKKLKEIGI